VIVVLHQGKILSAPLATCKRTNKALPHWTAACYTLDTNEPQAPTLWFLFFEKTFYA